MLPTDDAGQADLLNSIVTITDLLSHDNHDVAGTDVEILGKLIEAIARLKGVLIGNEEAMELFGESGGFESLLKAVENATVLEQQESPASENADDTINETESPQDETFQLR